jgi:hypothetical protein
MPGRSKRKHDDDDDNDDEEEEEEIGYRLAAILGFLSLIMSRRSLTTLSLQKLRIITRPKMRLMFIIH